MRIRCLRASVLSSILVAAISVSGCAALGRLSHFPQTPQVYGGTRTHIKRFPLGQFVDYHRSGGGPGVGNMGAGILFVWTFWWLPVDVALSFGIDTAALPVTLWTLLQDEPPQEDPPKRSPESVQPLSDGAEPIVSTDSVWKWQHPTGDNRLSGVPD